MDSLRRSAAVLLVLGLAMTACLPPPAAAGPEPPSSIATAYNTERKLVRSADGTLYAAITVNASGVPQTRVVESADGRSWTPLPPPETSLNATDRSALAIDSRGRLHLAWTSTVMGARQVVYARYEAGSWSPREQLSSSPSYAGFPSIAVDAQDRPHVAWYGFDGTFYQVYYRRLDPGGWTPERALTNEAVDATNPAIALGLDGRVHIAWFREHRTGAFTEVAYLRLEGDTVAETLSLSEAGVTAVDPILVVDARGPVHVVWSAFVGGADRLQYASRDTGWGPVETLPPGTLGAERPSLGIDAYGRLHLVWEGADGRIHAQRRESGVWSTPTVLSTSGLNRYPSVRWSQFHNPMCGANGMVDVIWTEESGGVPSLAYAALVVPLPCPDPPQPIPIVLVIGGLGSGIAAAVLILFLWVRRRWYPKPPRGPAP